jgi:hypothetical protein
MPQNSRAIMMRVKSSLSPAERSRLYLRRFRGKRATHTIRVSDKNINGQLKRGYLGPNEVNDVQAIKQAVSLFLWDSLQKSPKRAPGARRLGQIAAKGPKAVVTRALAQDRGNR